MAAAFPFGGQAKIIRCETTRGRYWVVYERLSDGAVTGRLESQCPGLPAGMSVTPGRPDTWGQTARLDTIDRTPGAGRG